MTWKKMFLCVAVGMLLSISGWATTYYVATSGDNSNNGSSENPWLTISYAITQVSTGDVINVADGIYTITSAINVNKGLTITGDVGTPANVLVTYGSASQTLDCFDMQANDITVQGVKVVNGRYGFNFAASDPTGCTISHCVIDYCYEGAIIIDGGSGHTISNNTITNCLTSGFHRGVIHIYDCPDVTVSGNTMTGNGLSFVEAEPHHSMEIYVKYTYPASSSERVEITGNTISGHLGACADIQIYDAPYTYIYNNTISNSENKGIDVFGIEGSPAYTSIAKRVEVIGNTISETKWGGIQACNAPYTYIYNNTINATEDKGINILYSGATGTANRTQVIGNTISLCKWPGIQVIGAPYTYVYNNTLTQCNYDGGDGTPDFDYGSITVANDGAVDGNNVIVDYNDVSDGGNGILIWSDNCDVNNNTIYNMGLTYLNSKPQVGNDGPWYNSAIVIGGLYEADPNDPSGTFIAYNKIHDNYWGLQHDSRRTNNVTAESNWWGHASGPGGEGPGTGDEVSANVDYNPWYNTDALTTKTYYVGAGEDYTTIQSGIDAASAGDIINVAEGTYTITSAIDVNKGVTITGDVGTPANVLVTYGSASQTLDCFDMQANDITVQGVKVVNGRYGFNFAASDPTGCTISDCVIDHAYEGAINIEGGSGHTISNNTITSCLTSGTKRGAIHIFGCPDVTIDGNTLTDNGLTGNHATMGIYVKFTYPLSSNERVEVTNNTISGMLGINADIQIYDAPYTYIYNNTISNSEDKGITIFGIDGNPAYTSTDNRVEIIGNNISSTYYPGLQACNAPYTYFYNNTLTHCNYYGGDGTGDFDYASIHIDAGSDNCLIDVNTVSDGINGIQVWSDNCTVTNNTIYDMGLTYADTKVTGDGTYYNSAILYGDMYDVNMPTSATISFNNIYDNYWGLFVISTYTGTVNAENNWWGDASGPTHASNPGGTGDEVSDNVDYDPWIGKTAYYELTVTETGMDYVFSSPDKGNKGNYDVTMNFSQLPALGGIVGVTFIYDTPFDSESIDGIPPVLYCYWNITTDMVLGDYTVHITFKNENISTGNERWAYWSDDVNEWMISSGTVNTIDKTIQTPSIDHFTPFCITNGYVPVSGEIGDIVPIYTNADTWFGNITHAATSLVPSTGLLAGIHVVVGFDASCFGFADAEPGNLWLGADLYSEANANSVTIDVGSDALSGAEADAIKSAIDMSFSITGPGEDSLVLLQMSWCDLMLHEEDASSLGNGYTKFYLGDFTKDAAGADIGDGYVDDWDLKDLDRVYWNPTPNPIKKKYDIGPTTDGYITGMPLEPDYLIDFEDLMLFGISYSFVSGGEGYPSEVPSSDAQSCNLRVDDDHDLTEGYYPDWETTEEWENQTFDIDMVAPSTGDIFIKGIDVTIEFDITFNSLADFTAGNMWDNPTPTHSGDEYGEAFFAKTTETGANWSVRTNAVHLMGTVVGTGEIAEGTFEVMKPGHSDIVITSCDVRDSVNASFTIPDTLNVRVKFYLGDFCKSPDDPSCGDGMVNGSDLNFFSNEYWLAPPSHARADIGPTVSGYVDTWPVPDGSIDYEDLWVFTRAYTLVHHNAYPYDAKTEIPDGEAPNRDKVEVSLGTPGMVDGILEVPVDLKGEVYDVQVVSLKLHYNPTVLRYIGVERGEILTEGEPAMMVAKLADIGELWVDAGCLEISGIDEAGKMLTVRFERVTDGAYELSLDDVHVLDIWNRVLCGPQTGTEDKPLPSVYALSQNYPNPVGNNKTVIRYALPERTAVEIAVYNLLGERVAVLATGTKDAGFYTVIWNTDNVPSGVYFYAMKTERFTETKKILVIR